jgi:hypothetical protein
MRCAVPRGAHPTGMTIAIIILVSAGIGWVLGWVMGDDFGYTRATAEWMESPKSTGKTWVRPGED